MLRLVAYLIVLAPVTYAALWLAERPGFVAIEWQGYQINMALSVLVGLVLFGTVIVMMSVLIIRSIVNTPKNIRQRNKIKRYENGIQALNQTMAALALADHREAERHLKRTRHFLKDEQPATRLLSVQLAHATNDKQTAHREFDAMLEHKDTRQLALRGKILELLQAGEILHARDYAEEAWSQRPHDTWLARVLLDILFKEKDFAAVEPIIITGQRKGSLDKAQSSYYLAMLYSVRALELMENEEWLKAQGVAELALKHDNRFSPARLIVAESLARQHSVKPLLRFIEQSWAQEPHPRYAELFIAHACDESASKTQKRLNRLADKNPDHLETLLLKARVHIHLGEWEQARNALKVSLSKSDSPRIYQMLSEVEIGETGDDKQAAHWLSQAVNAPRDATWTCANCGELHEQWYPHCSNCGQFDHISWMLPEQFRNQDVPLLKADSA